MKIITRKLKKHQNGYLQMKKADELIKKINNFKLTPKEAREIEKEVFIFLNDKNVSEEEKLYLKNNSFIEMLSMIANCYKEKQHSKIECFYYATL